MDDLKPLDPAYVQEILLKPPFVTLAGVINVRDLGQLPSTTCPGQITKPRYLFRSAELSGITDEGMFTRISLLYLPHLLSGKAKVQELGITKVFDLRSDTEIRKYNAPLPKIDGVEVIHIPVFRQEDYSPEMMAKYVRA